LNERKEMSDQMRAMLALALCTVILIGWNILYPQPKPNPQPPAAQVADAPATATPGNAAPAPTTSAPPATTQTNPVKPDGKAAPAPQMIAAKAADAERTIVAENDVYRIEFSNRGGVVKSWVLKKYMNTAAKPQTLDVVDAIAAQQVGAWPLSLLTEDKTLQHEINGALFVTDANPGVKAPGEITFEWSDARTTVRKMFRFSERYDVTIETAITRDGAPLQHGIAWMGGFGDSSAWGHAQIVRLLYRSGGAVNYLVQKNLGGGDHHDLPARFDLPVGYAGIEDRYFAAVFIPKSDGLTFWHWKHEVEKELKPGKKEKVPVAEMAAASSNPGPETFRLFVGPKDFSVLNTLDPPMPEIVSFGWKWLEVIAKPLFAFLKWLNSYTHNYGWAIVLMTLSINVLLFPLKVKSWRSMQKMQRVMPEQQRIKQKYSKYKMTDPRKQEEQQEMMALYKREGINPAGSCLPMVFQMPVWFALYQMLGAAIELRHAPWIFWLKDLSSPDPFYILPVLMAVSMYVMQKMTPATTTDPVQQQMMTIMPLTFGAMFVIFPVSSGLVLYILTSNLIAMGQQWYLNKSNPLKPRG